MESYDLEDKYDLDFLKSIPTIRVKDLVNTLDTSLKNDDQVDER